MELHAPDEILATMAVRNLDTGEVATLSEAARQRPPKVRIHDMYRQSPNQWP